MDTLNFEQMSFLSIFVFVIYGWLFTKTPLFVTGIIGVCASIFTGVISTKDALSSFAHPLIFIFLGGYLFAEAISQQGLDRRISIKILNLKSVRSNPNKIFLYLFALTAFFSMWISNTATTAMMLPIVLGVLHRLKLKDKKLESLTLIGIAYSANIGGIATPIGSTPNILAMAMLKEIAKIDISFLKWMSFGLPIALIFLFILYKYISRFIPSNLNIDSLSKEVTTKNLDLSDKTILILFCAMVTCWFIPSFLSFLLDTSSTTYINIKSHMHPGAIALLFSSLLFILPLNKKLLDSNSLKKIDWPSLLLFGSGLSLGKIFFTTGLAQIFGELLVQYVTGEGLLISLLIITFISIFATEVTSNTATANILLPIVISLALTIKASPLTLAASTAISCSLAFMLPVATPPNVIVYGSGKVKLKDMVRLGLILNITYGLLLTLIFYYLGKVYL